MVEKQWAIGTTIIVTSRNSFVSAKAKFDLPRHVSRLVDQNKDNVCSLDT